MGASFIAYLVMMTVGCSLFLLKIAPQRWSECSSADPHFLHWRLASIIRAQQEFVFGKMLCGLF